MKIGDFLTCFGLSMALWFFILIFIEACTVPTNTHGREVTNLYSVEKYKVHEIGVELWTLSEDGEEKGFFVEHDRVFSYEDPNEEISRVIALECSNECKCLRNAYLYFSIPEYKEYIKEIYDIE